MTDVAIISETSPEATAAADQAALDAVTAKETQLQNIAQESQSTIPAVAPAAPAALAADHPDTLFAGKYKSTDELVTGIQNLRTKLGYTSAYDSSGQDSSYLEGVYKALEGEMGRTSQAPPTQAPVEGAPTDDAPVGDPRLGIPKSPQESTALVNLQDLQQEYVTNDGALTEQTYVALEAKGLDRDLVNLVIHGQEALAERVYAEAFDAVGGEETYDAMVQWAGANLDPGTIMAFNSGVNGSPAERQLALSGLQAQYKAANPEGPTLVKGQATPSALPSEAFKSFAEYKAALNDPSYVTDPAFRAETDVKFEAAVKQGLI